MSALSGNPIAAKQKAPVDQLRVDMGLGYGAALPFVCHAGDVFDGMTAIIHDLFPPSPALIFLVWMRGRSGNWGEELMVSRGLRGWSEHLLDPLIQRRFDRGQRDST